MDGSVKDSEEISGEEEIQIEVIACKTNDDGKDFFQVKCTKYFWLPEDQLGEFKEYVDDFLEKKDADQDLHKVNDENDESIPDNNAEQQVSDRSKATKDINLKEFAVSSSLSTTLCPQPAKGEDGRFYCPECPKSFKRIFDYRMHERTHSGTNPHYCKICDSYFPRASKLTEHLRTNIHMRKVLEKGIPGWKRQQSTCDYCTEEFSSKEEMAAHLKDAHDTEPDCKRSKQDREFEEDVESSADENESEREITTYNCNICDLKFNRYSKLKRHFTTAKHLAKAKTTADVYICPECDARFHVWALLKEHLDTEHDLKDENNMFKCQKCDLSFESNNKWITHLSTKKHSANLINSFKASCCEKTFKSKKSCFNHERVHLRTSPYHCETCDRFFLKKHHLSAHLVGCQNNERPYACPYCTRSYKTSNQLEKHLEGGHSFQCVTCFIEFTCKPHLNKHLQEFPECVKHICSRCNNMRFETEEELKQHKHNIHEQKGKKTFTCSDCGKTYCEAFKLRQHMEWHATGRYPYQCDCCPVFFYKKSKLETHVNTVHLKVYHFECETCGKTFKTKNHLDQHKYIEHHGEGYVCQICDKTLFTLKTYEFHQLSHTKVNSSLVHVHNKVIEEEFDLRNLTNLSMGLDKSEGSMPKTVATQVKIPSIVTSEKPVMAESDSEVDDIIDDDGYDPAQMEMEAENVSVTTSQSGDGNYHTHDQDIVTPRFKIVTKNSSAALQGDPESIRLLTGQPVTITVAPSFHHHHHHQSGEQQNTDQITVTSDTIQQLKSTLSDLLSVTIQEQDYGSSVNESGGGSGESHETVNQVHDDDNMIEIVLVPNTEQIEDSVEDEREDE